jgi:hypothetical protein
VFSTIDIEKKLLEQREKSKVKTLKYASKILSIDYKNEININNNLKNSDGFDTVTLNNYDLSNLFSIKDIKNIAINYRLRFLPSKYAKKTIPQEAIFKIKKLEKDNNIEIKEFYLLAPSEAFDLEDVNKDPLLFIPLSNNKYLLVHKWGKDLSWYKKIIAYPLRNIETILLSIAITALIIALLTPTWIILNSAEVDMGYFGYHRAAWFVYSCILFLSITTFMCFSQGVYPSSYQWNKKTYN